MRRVTQQKLVEVDEDGIIKEGSSGDCYPACIASIFEITLAQAPGQRGNTQEVWDWLAVNFPGVGLISRSWTEPRDECDHHQGYWIATVVSSRFRERDCYHCSEEREESDPPYFWRRDECPACEGTGHARGLHAVVMEGSKRVWDPHPKADHDAPLRFVGEDLFIVTDPARLSPRVLPQPLAA